jgi:transposase
MPELPVALSLKLYFFHLVLWKLNNWTQVSKFALKTMAKPSDYIQLTDLEYASLTQLLTQGTHSAGQQRRARILDLLHRHTPPSQIAQLLSVSRATVYNVANRYRSEGYPAALLDKARSGAPARVDGSLRAQITALACSTAPEGHARWTLRLLADKVVELAWIEQISHTTIKDILKKTS